MKRLIFKKGINTRIFLVKIPTRKFDFYLQAMVEIENIKHKYYPRKNLLWNYIIDYDNDIGIVSVTKNYLGKLGGYPVYVNKKIK